MAAQKLTRGRFVQIIIMLTLLITAFTWRTMTFTDVQNIECELKPKCTFSVKNDKFELMKSDNGGLIITSPKGWDVKADESTIDVLQKTENGWLLLERTAKEKENTIHLFNQAQAIDIKIIF